MRARRLRVSPDGAPAAAGAGRLCSGLVIIWCVAAAAAIATSSRDASAYADGAPPGFSGGFGEESCHACHFAADVNTPPGEVVLSGAPDRFVAGQQYPLTVTLLRPGLLLGGFQLSARFADGAQAGTLERGANEETRVAIETQGGVQYANQRRPGAQPAAAEMAKWTLVWTAPAATGPVTFHLAANAADNDESTRGDFVYTATVETRPNE